MIHNKYFDLYFENPFKTYNKIKKYFKPIKLCCRFTKGKLNKVKILAINSFDLIWKDKCKSPRHELNPRIEISLFNYLHWTINFTLDNDSINDTVYWESALNWIYYNKPLHIAIKHVTKWSQHTSKTKKGEKIHFNILKEPWQTLYNKHKLPKLKYKNLTR